MAFASYNIVTFIFFCTNDICNKNVCELAMALLSLLVIDTFIGNFYLGILYGFLSREFTQIPSLEFATKYKIWHTFNLMALAMANEAAVSYSPML
jgi:hypothetical protein